MYMQIILRPENIYVSAALARSIVSFMYVIFFLSVHLEGLAPPPNTKKLATPLCVGTDMTPPPPQMDSPRNEQK